MSIDVVTFGCRLNAAESEVIRHEAAAAGVSDAVVVNTCAVTAEAVRQARQTIRKLRRERPDARIVVTGCAAQPVTTMRASGRSRRSLRMVWRACFTASPVTAQVLITTASESPATSASRRITSDS